MEDRRQADKDFYKSPAWRSLRLYHLQTEPLCADCRRPGNEVHHRFNRHDFPERELDSTALETLCKSCHSKRTIRERQGRYGHNIVLLGFPDQCERWQAVNGERGDLVIDANALACALGFPVQPYPADVQQLLVSLRSEVLRLVKRCEIKRRCIVMVSDYATASAIAKELMIEVTDASQTKLPGG